MKAEVFKRAWTLFNNSFGTFAECLVQAWKVVKLKFRMKKSVIRFEFKKANGEIRVAFGTLIQSISKGKGKPAPLTTLAFFDTIKEQVRSFKIENLTHVNK